MKFMGSFWLVIMIPQTVNGYIYFFSRTYCSAAKCSTADLKHVRSTGLKYMAKILSEVLTAATEEF